MASTSTSTSSSSSALSSAPSFSKWQLPAFTPADSNSSIVDPPLYTPLSSASSSSSKRIASKPTSTSSSTSSSTTPSTRSLESLRAQKAWDIAIAPAKAVPMQGFMVYMSGGGVQIFSLMIVFQLIKAALMGMWGVNTTFEPITTATSASASRSQTSQQQQQRQQQPVAQAFTQQKIVHVLSQGALLALGLYKMHSMGLLPTHESDWLAFSRQRIPLEHSGISLGGWWQE